MNTLRILLALLATHLGMAGAAQAQTYTPEALDSLRYMIEEEKLAGNVYRSFGLLYPTIKPFQNIPKSEDMHVAALVGQANLIGINVSDLTSLAAGHFQNPTLQSLYSSLVAQGSTSSFAALTVGKNIELLDIADLTAAMAQIPTNSSLYTTYGSLMNASNNHLRAFNSWLAVTPAPPVPEPETYAMLLAGLAIVGGVARRRKAA
ncbi:MAG: DUF2202 domain-containing protein [Azonexus sp.]|nr:DUF2202 domain-containing protein [Azonexus sp.]